MLFHSVTWCLTVVLFSTTCAGCLMSCFVEMLEARVQDAELNRHTPVTHHTDAAVWLYRSYEEDISRAGLTLREILACLRRRDKDDTRLSQQSHVQDSSAVGALESNEKKHALSLREVCDVWAMLRLESVKYLPKVWLTNTQTPSWYFGLKFGLAQKHKIEKGDISVIFQYQHAVAFSQLVWYSSILSPPMQMLILWTIAGGVVRFGRSRQNNGLGHVFPCVDDLMKARIA